jgi:uncharacterized membrane protein YqgA involved in biofilm formation
MIIKIIENMETVGILCMTFLAVLVVYCILPIKKMKAVNKELKTLLQVLPISKMMDFFKDYKKSGKPPNKETQKSF